MNSLHRRTFLKTTAAASAWWAVPGVMSAPTDQIPGANNDIRIAVIGVGGKGSAHLKHFMSLPGVRVVAACDPDQAHQNRARSIAEKAGKKIDTCPDMRTLFDRDDIDAVVIATQNHWHTLAAMRAMEAGKDVYVEKPVSHNVWEGRQLSEAARRTGRVVQAGTQNRSDVGLREAFPWIQAGNIGPIKQIVGLCYRNRAGIGKRSEPLTPPASLDYDLWLGPAEDLPLYRDRLHYDWHWMWNTGNGDIGNQAPHEIDLIQWIRGDGDLPKQVHSLGGRFGWNDAGNTPNMQLAVFDYGDYPVHFEVRNMWIEPERNAAPHYKKSRVGVVITCEDGEFRGGRGGGWIYSPDGERIKEFKGDSGRGHQQNFIDAVRAGDPSKLNIDIEASHKSAALAHLANISYRLGQQGGEELVAERLKGNAFLEERFEVFKEQLGKWNVDFKASPITVGSLQTFDPKQEKYVAGEKLDEANAMLTRPYRGSYEVKAQG
jgi:predicted dehydrogenase